MFSLFGDQESHEQQIQKQRINRQSETLKVFVNG